MGNCQGSDRRCTCRVVAGPNTTVTGGGSTGDPFVVSASVDCSQVRPCLSAGPGAVYDPATGVIGADVSTTAGNTLTVDGDGLYVPPAEVVAGCGLGGAGTAADPLGVVPSAQWSDLYACPIGDHAGNVFCDPASGALRTDPPPLYAYFNHAVNNELATPIAVPATESTIYTLTLTVTNPDPCRSAHGILFREADLDINLPPNSGGMVSIDGDDMNFHGNTGNATVFATHSQDNKLTDIDLAAGETRTISMDVMAGRGSGGATISRIQATLRVWIWSVRKV